MSLPFAVDEQQTTPVARALKGKKTGVFREDTGPIDESGRTYNQTKYGEVLVSESDFYGGPVEGDTEIEFNLITHDGDQEVAVNSGTIGIMSFIKGEPTGKPKLETKPKPVETDPIEDLRKTMESGPEDEKRTAVRIKKTAKRESEPEEIKTPPPQVRPDIKVRINGSYGSFTGKCVEVIDSGDFLVLCYPEDANAFMPAADPDNKIKITWENKTSDVYSAGICFDIPHAKLVVQVHVKEVK